MTCAKVNDICYAKFLRRREYGSSLSSSSFPPPPLDKSVSRLPPPEGLEAGGGSRGTEGMPHLLRGSWWLKEEPRTQS